jgi:hypothetical protein
MTTQRSDPAATGDPAAIRADIERTRAELGETVQALAGKADVKARAQDAAHAAKERAQQKVVDVGHAVQETAVEAGHVVQELVHEKVAEAGHAVQEVGYAVRRRPAPAAFALAGLAAAVTGLIMMWRRRVARRRRPWWDR